MHDYDVCIHEYLLRLLLPGVWTGWPLICTLYFSAASSSHHPHYGSTILGLPLAELVLISCRAGLVSPAGSLVGSPSMQMGLDLLPQGPLPTLGKDSFPLPLACPILEHKPVSLGHVRCVALLLHLTFMKHIMPTLVQE